MLLDLLKGAEVREYWSRVQLAAFGVVDLEFYFVSFGFLV
jgi:hypothetical protein